MGSNLVLGTRNAMGKWFDPLGLRVHPSLPEGTILLQLSDAIGFSREQPDDIVLRLLCESLW